VGFLCLGLKILAKEGEMGAGEFPLFKARRGDSVVGNGGSVGFHYIRGPKGWGEYPMPYCDGH